ncbi:MAG: DUF2339 domain-containing protein [Opitutaceae bacterium]|jgi:uncharacterized membrane protein
MPAIAILLILFLVLVLIILPIWTVTSVKDAKERTRRLEHELKELQLLLSQLDRHVAKMERDKQVAATSPVVASQPEPVAPVEVKSPVVVPPPMPLQVVVPPTVAAVPEPVSEVTPPVDVVRPPEMPTFVESAAVFASESPKLADEAVPVDEKVSSEIRHEEEQAAELREPKAPLINWELFMGVKLFAWIGGLALFLAVAFFVKYSFEHDLIPPELRVAIGYLVAIGLVAGGVRLSNKRYLVTAQTLCASGVVSLYAVTLACHSIYHFPFFGQIATFALMVLITTVAFLLAVRMDAKVVAVLGMLGGFLAPKIMETGHDNSLGLFGYLALLDLGLIAVALHRRWRFLVPLGAVGTLLLFLAWTDQYFMAGKVFVAMGVCLGFGALFVGVLALARRLQRESNLITFTALAAPPVAFGYAFYFLGYPVLAARPGLLFLFVLFAEILLLAVVLIERTLARAQVLAGLLVFLFLGVWTSGHLTEPLLPWALGGFLGFSSWFAGVFVLLRRMGADDDAYGLTAVGAPFVAAGFAFYFLRFPAFSEHPALLFAFLLVAELLLLVVVLHETKYAKAQLLMGLVAFGLLAVWTGAHLTTELMPWALGGFLGFAVLHTALPLVLGRLRPEFTESGWAQLAPPLTLLLVLGAIFKFETVSWLVWPCVLMLDLIAIGLALVTASLGAVAAVLVLTLVAMGSWVFHIPVATTTPSSLLLVMAAFALLFFGAGLWVTRKLGAKLAQVTGGITIGLPGDPRAHLPAMSALLPFTLLIMVIMRLPLTNPSPVFGLGLLLVVLTLGLARLLVLEWLPLAALAGVLAVESSWLSTRFNADTAGVMLGWMVGFYVVFAVFPFVFRRTFADQRGPWVTAALGAPLHFALVYRGVQLAYPNHVMGLLPAAFGLPALASLVAVLRTQPADHPLRLGRLAWFGGVALFFITLIFPIQFSRQWITLGWALEGAALLWLYHRVPHRGLRGVGVVLLGAVFARLALNPEVLGYHAHSSTPIFNWYLYTYGLAVVCFAVSARLLAPPRERVFTVVMPPLLQGGAVILSFLLLNIEIADFFTESGSALMFQFSGNLARDMTYTIAWALFAFGLLVGGIWKRAKPARYAALGLLAVALLKLFLHDLAHLGQLYRIAALAIVAVIAILASFVYQRFLPSDEKSPSSAR